MVHKENSLNSGLISEPNLENSKLKETARDHEDIHLSADQDYNKQAQKQESDSKYSPNLDNYSHHQEAATNTTEICSCCNLTHRFYVSLALLTFTIWEHAHTRGGVLSIVKHKHCHR